MNTFQIHIMSGQQEVELFEMIVTVANLVHQYLAIEVEPDEVLFMNIEVDMEIDDGDGDDMPRTIPLTQTWDYMEIDEVSGDGVSVQALMEEDTDARFNEEVDKYLVSVGN